MPKPPNIPKPSKIPNIFNRPSFRRSGMFFHSPLQKPVQPRRRSTLGQPDVAVEAALRQQLAEVFSPQSLLKVEVKF
uniref:Uncharacterized protein n=2 Tax=Meloidogyne incognita group TaxID=654580 RepID=A0A915N3Z7_MELJA